MTGLGGREDVGGFERPCPLRPAPPPRQVNLVSEHIWCEDFLVRSFYLKNVQTQETRTLTQFHFLSWPAEGTPASTRPLLDFRR